MSISSLRSFPVNFVSNGWDIFLGCCFQSGASSEMDGVWVSVLVFHIYHISGNGFDTSTEDFQICNFFTFEVGFHDVHIVSITGTEWNAVDLDPRRRENCWVFDINDFSTESSSDVGIWSTSKNFFQIRKETFARSSSHEIITVISFDHIVARVIVFVDDSLELF